MTSPVHSNRGEIRQLTGVRIVAALWVVMFHLGGWLYLFLPEVGSLSFFFSKGYLGVDLFFVLSGFILAYQYWGRVQTRASYVNFLVRRLARIYPVHLTMLLAFLVLLFLAPLVGVPLRDPGKYYTPLGFVLDLTLLRAWVGDSQGWNIPAWSISAEWLAYVLFPLIVALVAVVARRKPIIGYLALAVGLLAARLAVSAIWPSEYGAAIPAVRVLIAFALGVVAYRIVQDRPSHARYSWSAFATMIVLLFATPFIADPGVSATVAVGLSTLLIALLYLDRGRFARFLGSRPMEYGGRISYSLYMTRSLVQLFFGRVFTPESWGDKGLVVRVLIVVAALVVQIGAAAVMYHVVERPAQRFIVQRWDRRRVAARPERSRVPV